jgi:hypothetical protein
MKKILSFIFITFTTFAFSQAPQGINYQGIARNSGGTVLSTVPIGIKLELHQGSAGGSIVFSETHTPTTNQFGLFTLTIGSNNSPGFAGINWGAGPYYLEVFIDPAGGTSYSSVGTQQFMSVPYALYAETSGNSSITPTITINTPNTVTGSAGSYNINVPAQTLSVSGNSISISNGNTITLPISTTYSAGNGIDISGGIISNTLTPVTPTISSSGIAVVTPTSGNNFNIDVAAPSLTYNNSNNLLTLTQGTATTTALLNGTGSSTINMNGAGIVNVSPTTGSAFTVTVPNPTFTPTGPVTITGSYPNLTVNSPASATPYVGTSNNITVTSNTINLATTGVTANTYGANTGNAVPTFSVDNFGRLITATQYTPAITGDVIGSINTSTVSKIRGINVSPTAPTLGQVLQFTAGAWTPGTPAAPTLSLSGSVLSSGPVTNSVNLASVNGLWSASSTTAIIQTNTTNNVGIGMTSPAPQFKLDVIATVGNSVTIHGLNSGTTDAFAGVYGENTSSGLGVYAQSNSGKGVFGKSTSGSGVYGESTTGDAGKFILSSNTTASNALNAQTNGTGAALFAKTYNTTSTALAAKIEGNLDIQNAGSTTGRLINAVQTNSVSDGFALDITNVNNGGNGLQVRNFGQGKAGYFEISNAGNNNPSVEVLSNGIASAVRAVNSNTTSSGSHAIVAQAVSGAALSAASSSTLTSTIHSTNSGSGTSIFSFANDGLAYYGRNASNSGTSVMELESYGNGSGIRVSKIGTSTSGNVASLSNNDVNNSSDAVLIFNAGPANSLFSSNTNASPTAYAGMFDGGVISKGKTSTATSYALRALNATSTSIFSVRGDGIVEINGNVGINILNPTNKLHVNTSNTNAAAIIENTISGSSSSAHGLFAKATSTHSLAAALYAQSSGAGPSVYGIKSPSETGIAGRFELLNNGNSADAILAKTDGSGAAVHAVASTTTNMVSTLALWLENGHIKATGAVPNVGIPTNSLGGGVTANPTITALSNDVKGTVTVTSNLTGISPGGFVDVNVAFSKAYTSGPTVIITPVEPGKFTYAIINQTSTNFVIRIVNNTATSIGFASGYSYFRFNYFVIE